MGKAHHYNITDMNKRQDITIHTRLQQLLDSFSPRILQNAHDIPIRPSIVQKREGQNNVQNLLTCTIS